MSFVMNAPVFLILTLTVGTTTSAKILGVFMVDMYSHFNFNNAIMEILAMNGHEVTVISPFKPKNSPTNITYIQAIRDTPEHLSHWSKIDLKRASLWQAHEVFGAVTNEACEIFMTLQETKDILTARTRKFDLMFVGIIQIWDCYFAVAYQSNIPIIVNSALDLRYKPLTILGNPFNPAITPHFHSTIYTSKMTFVERVWNTVEVIYVDFLHFIFMKLPMRKFHHKYHLNEAPWNEAVSLYFLNSHRSILSEPRVPGVIEIAGVHLKPPKLLPANIDEFICGAKHGVVLFSLGTVASAKDLLVETRQIFKNVFARIPQRVIWKFGEQIDGISDNVKIMSWISQQDILAQGNVILFISHAGKSSTIEAIHSGTPILALPLFSDQFVNAGQMKELGVGLELDLATLTETSLMNGLEAVLQNKSYQDRMKTLSQAFNNRPMSPQETVLYWTEYVLRHNGTNHLKTTAADMPFYQYFLLDVICFIVICAIVMLLLLRYAITKIWFQILHSDPNRM